MPSSNSQVIRVAIIDDDPHFLELATHLITRSDLGQFEVVTFQNPMDIFDPNYFGRFDVYIVDCKFRQEDGINLIKGLRGKLHPGPYILCSGVLTDSHRERAKMAGIRYVLEKDEVMDKNQLAERIIDVLAKQGAT